MAYVLWVGKGTTPEGSKKLSIGLFLPNILASDLDLGFQTL